MKNFTSELYLKTSNLTDEKVCIGLFAISEDSKHFAFSSRKLKLADKLLEQRVFRSVSSNLKRLKREIDRLTDNSVLPFESGKYNSASFEYLSRYSNGLLFFTEPRPIALELTDETFEKLFVKLVGEAEVKSDKRTDFKEKASKILKRKEFDAVDRNYKVTPELIRNMYAAHTIDFIGKNGVVLAGNTIDFNAMPATIDKGLFEFSRISKGLARLSEEFGFDGPGEYTAYFEFPEDADSRKVLDLAIKDESKGFELKELDTLELTAKRISRGNYVKFSSAVEGLSSSK